MWYVGEEAGCDAPSGINGYGQAFGSQVVHHPIYVPLIFLCVEGAGAVDEQSARSQGRPDIGEDVALSLPADLYILGTPLAHGYLVLAKHALATARSIHEDEIKKWTQWGEVSGIVGGDDAARMSPLGDILGQHLGTGTYYLIRYEYTFVGKERAQQGTLATRSGAEVEGSVGFAEVLPYGLFYKHG